MSPQVESTYSIKQESGHHTKILQSTMAIWHRKIITSKTNGGGGSFSPNVIAACNDDDDHKSHTAKQRREKSPAVVAVAVFLGLLIPVLLFQRHRGDASSSSSREASHLRRVITNDDGPVPKPWGWQRWEYDTFKDKFNCSGYVEDETKPLPTMEYWQTMLDAYNQVVDPTYKFDDLVPPTQGYRLNEDGPQPYYAKLSPGKGRGVFASRDIKKGEIVHDGTKSDVVFPDALSWKRLMFALPRKMACDNAEWTFTQQYEEDGPMRVVSSLNIAILMNEGNTADEKNVEPQNEDGEYSEYATVLYATRDIKKDEEILMDYDDYPTDYDEAGIGSYQKSMLEELFTFLSSVPLGFRMIFKQFGSTLGLGS